MRQNLAQNLTPLKGRLTGTTGGAGDKTHFYSLTKRILSLKQFLKTTLKRKLVHRIQDQSPLAGHREKLFGLSQTGCQGLLNKHIRACGDASFYQLIVRW